MTNKFNGEVTLEIGEKPHIVCFDWAAIGKLNTKFTPVQLESIMNGGGAAYLLDLLIIGLQKHQPDIKKSFIENNLPPYVPTMEAVGRSMDYGYFGADGAPKVDEAAAKKKGTTKKPNARKQAQAKKKKN